MFGETVFKCDYMLVNLLPNILEGKLLDTHTLELKFSISFPVEYN